MVPERVPLAQRALTLARIAALHASSLPLTVLLDQLADRHLGSGNKLAIPLGLLLMAILVILGKFFAATEVRFQFKSKTQRGNLLERGWGVLRDDRGLRGRVTRPVRHLALIVLLLVEAAWMVADLLPRVNQV